MDTPNPPSPDTPPQRPRRLTDLDVHFISLVARGANRRAFLAKEAGEGEVVVEKELPIAASESARHIVFGIVYAPDEVDAQGDLMTAGEIEKAAYGFLKARRTHQIDADHDGAAGRGYVGESWIVRPGDPLFPEEKAGAWAVAVRVSDAETWDRIERGDLRALSMAGLARVDTAPSEEAAKSEPDERRIESLFAERLATIDRSLAEQARLQQEVAHRLEALEKSTPGRQSLVGEADTPPARPPFRGVRIV